ncbi:phage capsid protein [Pseudomonas sp. HMWF032]|uniref:phage capsid protein n=1 Tax=Pseudomonas sp. HMWF032 TaxID=2056866 RepID=UPI000D367543|nr:phage capsid protein [Pseudomonas sp. HMWF032]PTS86438.1 phage capsid protein [Pseudomonas sp. HMWF032]PTT81373.1 phage capsid protein [Pseudomonas sp. HMWF010]
MASTTVAAPGQINGTGDRNALFMKVFAGEVLTAFEQATVTMNRHQVRTIPSGKSASFPVVGRGKAKYLAPGNNLDDQRQKILHTEKTITIDGLLTADVLITDIEDAMNHFDVRAPYATQLGEALALAADGAVLAEGMAIAKAAENLAGLGSGGVIGVGAPAVTAEYGRLILGALIAARGKFAKLRVPKSERTFYADPDVISAILLAFGPFASNFVVAGSAELTGGLIIRWAGFEIIEAPHFLEGGAEDKHAADVAAVGLCMHRSAVGTVKLKDLAMEKARRIEFQADMVVGKYAMGHGGLRPEGALLLNTTPPSPDMLAAVASLYDAEMTANGAVA